MKNFKSPFEFAAYLGELAITEVAALKSGLEVAAKLVENEAKKEIGHLQPAVGDFSAWPELADSTKADKEREGYVFNEDYNPLLRNGELRDSYEHEVKGLEAVIGSKMDIAAYQELGTDHIPARPVLAPAAFKNKEKIRKILGAAAFTGLKGEKKLYGFDN